MGPNQTEAVVDDQWFRARMGWAFRVAVRRSDIESVTPVADPNWWWGIGAHLIGANRWIINGTLQNLVEVKFRSTARGSALGLPTKVDSVIVSIANPEDLVQAIQT